jgi:hemoglobin/transferrin/lactoferrin receptor protein
VFAYVSIQGIHFNQAFIYADFFIFFFIINNFHLFAQIDTTKKALPDVVVFPTLSKNIVQKVDFISDKNAINQQSNTGDILSQSGQVFVQKSQSGGGSPVIRGFEASRV